MRARFQTTANHMMLNINLWSTLVLGLGEPDVFGVLLPYWRDTDWFRGGKDQ